uniref:Replication-associated protein n=1 Tax=Cressdnaviricota sp. TaxID=2748378 RepID=A0A345MQ25_9VIRU
MPGKQHVFWFLTIPAASWSAPAAVPNGIKWIKGQKEIGESGFEHWQLVCGYCSRQSLRSAKLLWPSTAHLEPCRSAAADAYVWKEETRVHGSQFELGLKPHNPAVKTDWEMVWKAAIEGRMLEIPASVRIQHYRTLRAITGDHSPCLPIVRKCYVFWGKSGTGKSRRAWEEAGELAYAKGSRTKFWDGYQGESSVIIDEFRGGIDVTYLLRWLDRYPVRVEIKGSSMPLSMKTCWITSNISPVHWYPDLDDDTLDALKRRLDIIYFP